MYRRRCVAAITADAVLLPTVQTPNTFTSLSAPVQISSLNNNGYICSGLIQYMRRLRVATEPTAHQFINLFKINYS